MFLQKAFNDLKVFKVLKVFMCIYMCVCLHVYICVYVYMYVCMYISGGRGTYSEPSQTFSMELSVNGFEWFIAFRKGCGLEFLGVL